MQHCWYKCGRGLLAVMLVVGLGACVSTSAIRQLAFQLDDGTTQTFDFTSRGALPADNGIYKIEGLGLMVYQEPASKQVFYAWDVTLNMTAKAVSKITLSQVLNTGVTQTLLIDHTPQLENGDEWRHIASGGRVKVQAARWRAVSPGQNMAEAKWLAQSRQEAMFVFKLDIEDIEKKHHVLYQPMVIGQESKKQYLKVLQAALADNK